MALTAEEKRKRALYAIEWGTERHPGGLRALRKSKQYIKVLREFQKLRRLQSANEFGLVDCVTCDRRGMPWSHQGTHGGHFMKARYRFTCFDPRNVHVQCYACNALNYGEQDAYRTFLGEELSAELKDMALSNQTYCHSVEELAELLLGFRDEFKAEKKARGL